VPTPTNPPAVAQSRLTWKQVLLVVVLLAAAACADSANSQSTARSTHPPPTGTTVPAFDRGRFAASSPFLALDR
jgi:hypothetical protein